MRGFHKLGFFKRYNLEKVDKMVNQRTPLDNKDLILGGTEIDLH